MELLVTGANGFVGRHLCRGQLERGHRLHGALRAGRPRDLPRVEYHEIPDFSGAVDWTAALQGIEAVVHCAARVHVQGGRGVAQRAAMTRLNVEASVDLARQAAAAGVKRFCFMSSIGAAVAADLGPQAASPYQASKLAAEVALREVAAAGGLELVILRPPLVYGVGAPGNVARLERALVLRRPLPLASLDARRPVLAVENLVDAVALLLEHPGAPGGIFALSDGPSVSVPEFARMLGTALGRPARLYSCPPVLIGLALRLAGLGASRAALLEPLEIDETPLRAGLGWEPPYSTQVALSRAYGAEPYGAETAGPG